VNYTVTYHHGQWFLNVVKLMFFTAGPNPDPFSTVYILRMNILTLCFNNVVLQYEAHICLLFRGFWVQSEAGQRPSWVRLLMIFPIPSRLMLQLHFKLGHKGFFPHFLQSIIHQSSYNWTLNKWIFWETFEFMRYSQWCSSQFHSFGI
jgi:hypothetical protein